MEPLKNISYEVKNNETVIYQFPGFVDPEGTKVKLKIIFVKQDFMNLNSQKNTLEIKPTQNGTYTVEVELEDGDGKT